MALLMMNPASDTNGRTCFILPPPRPSFHRAQSLSWAATEQIIQSHPHGDRISPTPGHWLDLDLRHTQASYADRFLPSEPTGDILVWELIRTFASNNGEQPMSENTFILSLNLSSLKTHEHTGCVFLVSFGLQRNLLPGY